MQNGSKSSYSDQEEIDQTSQKLSNKKLSLKNLKNTNTQNVNSLLQSTNFKNQVEDSKIQDSSSPMKIKDKQLITSNSQVIDDNGLENVIESATDENTLQPSSIVSKSDEKLNGKFDLISKSLIKKLSISADRDDIRIGDEIEISENIVDNKINNQDVQKKKKESIKRFNDKLGGDTVGLNSYEQKQDQLKKNLIKKLSKDLNVHSISKSDSIEISQEQKQKEIKRIDSQTLKKECQHLDLQSYYKIPYPQYEKYKQTINQKRNSTHTVTTGRVNVALLNHQNSYLNKEIEKTNKQLYDMENKLILDQIVEQNEQQSITERIIQQYLQNVQAEQNQIVNTNLKQIKLDKNGLTSSLASQLIQQQSIQNIQQSTQDILNKTFVIITTSANAYSQQNNANKIFPHLKPKTNSKFLKNLEKIRINPENSSIVEMEVLSYKKSKKIDNSSPQNIGNQEEKRLNYNSSHERSNKATGIGEAQQKISVMNIDESNVESSYQLAVRNTDINEQNIKIQNINLNEEIDQAYFEAIVRPNIQDVALIKNIQNEVQNSPSGISNKNVIVLTKDSRKSNLQLQENFNIFKNRDQVKHNSQIENQQTVRGQTQLKITTKTSKKNSNVISPIQTTPTSMNDISQSMLNYHQQSPVLTPQLIKKNQQLPQTKQSPLQNLIKGSTLRNQNSQMSKIMSIMKNKNESDQNKSQIKRSSQFQENGIVIGKKTGEKVIQNDYLKELQLKPFFNANIQFQKEYADKTIQEATQNGSEESRIHLTNQMLKNTSHPISSPMNNQRQSSLLDPRFMKMDSPQSIVHDDFEEEYNSIPTSHLMKTKIFMQKSSPANHQNQSQDFQIKKKILKSPLNKAKEQFLVGSQIVEKVVQKPKKKINLNDIVQPDKLSQKIYTSELSRRGDDKKDKFATINQVSMHNIPKIQNINVASDNESDDASQKNSSALSIHQKQKRKPLQTNDISPQSQRIHEANINQYNEMQKASNMSTVINEVHYRNQSPFLQSDFVSFHKSNKIRNQVESSVNKESRVQSLNIQKESSNIEKASQQNDKNTLKSGSFQVNIQKDENNQDLMQKCIVDVQLKLITEYTQKLIEQQLQQQNQVADAFKMQFYESISALQKVQLKQLRNKNKVDQKNQGLVNRFSGKRNILSVTPEPQKVRNQNSAKRHLKFINQVIQQYGVLNYSESIKKSLSPQNKLENQPNAVQSNIKNQKEKINNKDLSQNVQVEKTIHQKQKKIDNLQNQKNRSISTMATGLCIQVVGNKKKYDEILKKQSLNNISENRQKVSNESFLCSCGNQKSGNLSIQQNQNKEVTATELCKACLQNQSQNQQLFHELMLNMWTGEQQTSPSKSQINQAIKIENSGKNEVVGILGIKVVGKQFQPDQSSQLQSMRKSQNKNEIVIELNDKQKQIYSPQWPSQNTNKEENSQNIENLLEASNNQSINSAVITPTAYPQIQPQIKNHFDQGTNSANYSQNIQQKYNDQNLVNYFNFKSMSHQPIKHNQKQILTSVLKNSSSRKQYKTQSQNINFQEIRNQTQPAILPISAGFIQSAEGPDQQETFSNQKESFEGSLVEGKINRTRLIQNSQKTIKIFDNQIIAIKNQENVTSRQKNQFLIKENSKNNLNNFQNNLNTERVASQLQKYSQNASGIPGTDKVQSLYKNQTRKNSYISRPHTLGNTFDNLKIEEENSNQIDKKDTLPIYQKSKIYNNASALSANTPKPFINTLNSIWEDEGNKILTQLNPIQLTPAYQTNNNWEQVSSLFSQENIQSQIIQDINYNFNKGNPNIQLPIIQAQKLHNNQQHNFKNFQQLQLQQIYLNQSQIVPGPINQNQKQNFKFSIQTSERRNMQLKINKQKKESFLNTQEMTWIGGRLDSTPDERSAHNKTNTNFSIKERGNSDFSTTHYPQNDSNFKNMHQTYNQNFYKPPLKSMVQKKKITDLKLQAVFHQ